MKSNSGNVTIATHAVPERTSSTSGSVLLETGTSQTESGQIVLKTGKALEKGRAGSVVLQSGSSVDSYDGGKVELTGGETFKRDSEAGAVVITGGKMTTNNPRYDFVSSISFYLFQCGLSIVKNLPNMMYYTLNRVKAVM